MSTIARSVRIVHGSTRDTGSALRRVLTALSLLTALLLAAAPVQAQTTELFFSEYIEGSSNNKALEIYNGTGAAVDLSAGQYVIQMYFNGNSSAGLTITLTGTVADGDVFVLAHSSANATILAQADQTNGAGWFNGDDAVVLRKGGASGTIVDVIGQIGTDPGSEWGSGVTSTADNTLRRQALVCAGDTDGSNAFDPSVEWDGYATDTFGDLGSHTSACAVSPVINEFSASTTGTDVEYVEFYGFPGTDYSHLTILEIEGDFSGTATGTVDEVIACGTTDANGFYLVNLAANALENGTITLLLVENFTGALGNDLDTNDDGVFDTTPWTRIVDAVAVHDGGASDLTYGAPVLGVSYDGLPFAPGGASRIPDGADTDAASDWVRNDFDLAGITGYTGSPEEGEAYNTPGLPNRPVRTFIINEFYADVAGTGGDANGDGTIDIADDKFVEIVNISPSDQDISDWTLSDSAGTRHTFPPGTVVPAGCVIVVFSGGTPTGTFGGAVVQTASTGTLSLDNTGDTITLSDDTPALRASVTYGAEADVAQSLTLDPDITGTAFVRHTTATSSGGALFSPGTLINGSTFSGCALTIPQIQGDGLASPYVGQTVVTRGNIVTALDTNGFFIQTPDGADDGDADTSEGIFVYTSSAPTVAVGDEVDVRGTVAEYYDFTEITSPTVTVNSSGNTVPLPVTLDATTPVGTQPWPAIELERYESMLVEVTGARATSASDQYGDVTMTSGPGLIFREPGIEYPGLAGLPVYDGNPEVFDLDPNGLLLPEIEVFGGATFDATGPLGYSFGDYQILPVTLSLTNPTLPRGVRLRAPGEFTVATQNFYRIYDTADDPAKDDDVFTAQEYADRLNKASLQVREVLGAPDILGVQEVENITVLEDLAAEIAAADPTLNYTAVLEEGWDIGSIDVGFLVRDTMTIVNWYQVQRDDTFDYGGTTYILHDRPPLLLEATYSAGIMDIPLSVLVVHNRSIDDTSDRVRVKRWTQAYRISQFVQSYQETYPDIPLVVLGDFNGFEFTSGYVDPLGQITGSPDPLGAMYPATDEVDPDLTNQIFNLPAEERYTYHYDGDAQALDHILTSASAADMVVEMQAGRGNTDAPRTYMDDPDTPLFCSDHDGLVLYLRTAAVGDRVWNDLNQDGVQDVGESGVEGVWVSLYTAADEFLASVQTDDHGEYYFDGLLPGDYYVIFDAPDGYVRTYADQGADDAADSDADPTTGITAVFSLAAGEENTTLDAGLIEVFTITATAGLGGAIDPSGDVVVWNHTDQSFTIAADAGNTIRDVLVDGVSQGALAAYTFYDVTADHTIEAVFNRPPVAVDDAYSLFEGGALPVTPGSGVLANDSDPDGDPLTAATLTLPTHGTLMFDPDGSFTYTPDLEFTGEDSFTYQASDGELVSDTATVILRVRPVNDPPVAVPLALTTFEDTPVGGDLQGADPDGDALAYHLAGGPVHGTLTGPDPGTGAFTYLPDPFFAGVDTFTFTVSDGEFTSPPATVTVTVLPLAHQAFAAHVVDNPDWFTTMWVANAGDASTPVFAHAFAADGRLLEAVPLGNLPPRATLTLDAGGVFAATTLAEDAWVRIGTGGRALGMLAFGTTDGLSYAAMPMFDGAAYELVFPYVYIDDVWYTGITLINVGAAEADVLLEAVSETGDIIDQADVAIPSRGKYVRMVNEIFNVNTPSAIRFIRVTATAPLIGFELFGTSLGHGVAGLPAFADETVDLSRKADQSGKPDAPQFDGPSMPTGFWGWGLSDTSVRLEWDANPAAEGVTHYNVYGKDDIFTILPASTTGTHITMADLPPGVCPLFSIRAVNADGVESLPTNWLPVCTLPAGETDYAYRMFYNEVPDPSAYMTGLTVSNLGEGSTTVQLTLYDATGAALWQDHWAVASLEQVTRELPSMLGGSVPPGAAYLKAAADSPILGFELFHNLLDKADTFRLDGVAGTGRGGRHLAFPMVRGGADWTTSLRLTELAGWTDGIIVTAYGPTGALVGTWTTELAAHGQLETSLEAMFPGQAAAVASLGVVANGRINATLVTVSADLSRMAASPGLPVAD
jgi:predicted extracellular nuclease